MTKAQKVGIVGGSIAGSSAAILMSRAGHDVTVFERSRGALQGRGGGIGTPMATFKSLIEEDILDADSTASWWKSSVTFPENFTYEDES